MQTLSAFSQNNKCFVYSVLLLQLQQSLYVVYFLSTFNSGQWRKSKQFGLNYTWVNLPDCLLYSLKLWPKVMFITWLFGMKHDAALIAVSFRAALSRTCRRRDISPSSVYMVSHCCLTSCLATLNCYLIFSLSRQRRKKREMPFPCQRCWDKQAHAHTNRHKD